MGAGEYTHMHIAARRPWLDRRLPAAHSGGVRDDRPAANAGIIAVGAVAALGALLLGLAGGSGIRTAAPAPEIRVPPLATTTTAGEPSLPAQEPDTWELIPEGPLSARAGFSAVWTGRELIVWGGNRGAALVHADGAAYDPATGAWRELAPAPPGFGPRLWHSAVWTGSEMLLWGGYVEGRDDVEGVAYDPVTDLWRPLAAAGGPHRWLHTAVWTGREMIVWGGEVEGGQPGAGGLAYDAAADTWRRLPEAPVPPSVLHTAVWTGREMIVWGGAAQDGEYSADGATYDPATDRWELLLPAPLGARARHAAVWDGEAMAVWAGRLVPVGPNSSDGAAYDPETREWSPLPATALEERESPVLVATDAGLVAWSGNRRAEAGRPRGLRTGSALASPDRGWRQLRSSPFEGGGDFAGVWTGDVLLVWGAPRSGPAVGATYRP